MPKKNKKSAKKKDNFEELEQLIVNDADEHHSALDNTYESGNDQDPNEDVPFEVDVEEPDAAEMKEVISQYTDDEEIQEDFAERQQLNTGGGKLLEDLEEHTELSPEISAGDVDARWDQADQAGEEAVGGENPTPDQDIVDEIGQAVGLTYNQDEELRTEDKLAERDQNRWELDGASADVPEQKRLDGFDDEEDEMIDLLENEDEEDDEDSDDDELEDEDDLDDFGDDLEDIDDELES